MSVSPSKRADRFWKNQKVRPIGQDASDDEMEQWWRAISLQYQRLHHPQTKSTKPKSLPKKPTVTVTVKKVGPPRPFTDVEMAEARQRRRKAAAEKKFEKLLDLKKHYKGKENAR